jgi:hypothetical protein
VIDKNSQRVLQTVSLPHFDDISPSCHDPKERVAVMDHQGISNQIIYPNIIGFGAQTLMTVSSDTKLRV